VRFGSLKNTNPEFKKRLYESFLQASDTTTTFGQFFTPRKIVSAIHDIDLLRKIYPGKMRVERLKKEQLSDETTKTRTNRNFASPS
jgi:hypothetical protein